MSTENPDSPTSVDLVAESAATSPGPGAMIREARTRARLSLEDLAIQTKLSRSQLDALERDDFGALLEAVYVRGYYRKCAKVLGLPEQQLLDAYQARVAPKSPLPPAKLRLASGSELGSSSKLPVSMAIIAAIVAVVVCGFIWMAREQAPVPPAITTQVEIEQESETVVSEPVQPAATETADPALNAGTATDAAAVSPAEATATGTPAVAPTVAPTGTTSPSSQPAAAAATTAGGTRAAVLTFTAASWVRVDDANGKTLLNGLMRAGDQQVLEGAQPLNVFLGNAPGVKLEFEGRAIDLKPFQRDNATARLTLPLPTN